MRTLTRPLRRSWSTFHPVVDFTDGPAERPCTAHTVSVAPMSANMSGPVFKGMDPSDPATYVRPWNPTPGMISRLNFDGAKYQATTPTGGNQRGPQTTRRRAG